MNSVAFLLAKLRDIRLIHCKAILAKLDKLVMNGLKSIVLDYEAREFKVVTVFADGAFKPMIDWMRQDLYIDLTTCAADLHVPRAKNTIRFVKERVRCIQSESPFKSYTKTLTIEMVKCVTALINSFNKNQECIQ